MTTHMVSDAREDLTFSIEAADPMLAGHFPGQPIVPGVVLLDRAFTLIVSAGGPDIAGLKSAKFLRPVLPAQRVAVRFSVTGDTVAVEASVAGDIVMRATASIVSA